MEICLVRHAIAEERGAAWPDDGLRPLTPGGKEKMASGAIGLGQLFQPGAIATSPLTRAVQTAEILAEAYGLHALERRAELASGDHAALAGWLSSVAGERWLLVGHEPHLSGLLSWLTTADEWALNVEFKKGAAALLRTGRPIESGRATLAWLLQPGALRGLSGHRQAD
jgi:phosphohistidine phosphatase